MTFSARRLLRLLH